MASAVGTKTLRQDTQGAMTALMLNWRQACEAGVLACGGKGYHLAKLHGSGSPVPNGGVLVAGENRQFIDATARAGRIQAVRHPVR